MLDAKSEFYSSLVEILKPTFDKHRKTFANFETNLKRTDFFVNNLKQSESDPTVEYVENVKSDQQAVEFRNKGNAHFKSGNYKEALKYYTLSIAYAKTKPIAALAYGNRSAVLTKMQLHKECVADIARAFEHDCPEQITSKLLLRRKKSLCLLNANQKSAEKVIIESKNSWIQSASSCIQISYDYYYGRYIQATRNIEIGELLVVEEPFTAGLIKDHLFYCHECTSLCYNLIPCGNCSQALYCSEKCKIKALKNHHIYECSISYSLQRFLGPLKDIFLLALKTTLVAIHTFDKNVNNRHHYFSDRYNEICTLLTHTEKLPPEKLFVMSCISALIFNFVKEKTTLFVDYTDFEETFKELFLFNLQAIELNSIEISSIEINDFKAVWNVCYALGLYSLCSLFNHSCHPNVFFYNQGSTIIVRANTTIQKGEQCFISYGYHYHKDLKLVRQILLRNKYYFTCTCEACKNNWPQSTHIRNQTRKRFFNEVKEQLMKCDKTYASAILPELINCLEQLEGNAASASIVAVHKLIMACYYICDAM